MPHAQAVAPVQAKTKLSQTAQLFCAAVTMAGPGRASAVQRAPYIDGVESFAAVLNELNSGMGDYLLKDVKKLRASKADASESSYGPWLLSEAPVHAQTGYKSYVDDSAWMANLWIYRTLDFFVELFAQLAQGNDTRQAVDTAYGQTLSKHHNFVQRQSFNFAAKQLPNRVEFLKKLAGKEGSVPDVERDFQSIVTTGRCIVVFCDDMNKQVELRMEVERKASRKKK